MNAFSRIGGRKLALGILYLVGGIGCILTAVWRNADPGVIAAVAGAFLSLSSGLGIVVWGNVKEHETNRS